MTRMVARLTPSVKRQLRRMRRKTREKGLAMRCQIVLLSARGHTRAATAEAVGCSVSWVYQVLARFREAGVAGLPDRREDNGELKLDERYLNLLYELVDRSPRDYGYARPTWTQELLAKVMHKKTGVKVHTGTMSRALKRNQARLGRPRPTVGCPWSKRRKRARLRALDRLVQTLGPEEVAVYLDEIDIHLNPDIGPDWMNKGQQKTVLTPGKNVKRYICGALDALSDRITWVASERKNSQLFIDTLRELVRVYAGKKRIHVILDNFRIHDSLASQAAVNAFKGRIVLHFLPPYSPEGNRIEREWLDLHAQVTRNHCCRDIDELMREIRAWLARRNRRAAISLALAHRRAA
jgi:transposase